MTMQITASRSYIEETVNAGASKTIELPTAKPATVAVHPATGGSVTVEFTVSSRERVDASTARWIAWGKGTVSVPSADVFDGPVTAIRVTATGAACVVEVQQ